MGGNREYKSEVVKVTQLDYTFDRQIELERDDARKEGLEKGLAEGLAKGIAEGITKGLAKGRAEGFNEAVRLMLFNGKTVEEIAAFCGVNPEKIKAMIDN